MHKHIHCCTETQIVPKLDETPEQRIAAAQAIWNSSRAEPIADREAGRYTPAWRYLRETRGLPLQSLNPRVAHYDPYCAVRRDAPPRQTLVFACRDAAGEIAGVQLIHLHVRRDGKVTRGMKFSRGVVRGNPVLIPPATDSGLLLACEGPEDALSLRLATGGACHAALSANNLRHLPLDHGARVTVFLDRLRERLDDDDAALAAVAREFDLLCDRGVEVWTALPPPDCVDANEAFIRHGREALREAVEAAQRYVPSPRDLGHAPAAPVAVAATAPAVGAAARQRAAYAAAALRRECDAISAAAPGAQERTLNNAAVKVGAVLAGLRLPSADAADQLLRAALAMRSEHGRPPWTERELRGRIRRALEAGARNPRVPAWRG